MFLSAELFQEIKLIFGHDPPGEYLAYFFLGIEVSLKRDPSTDMVDGSCITCTCARIIRKHIRSTLSTHAQKERCSIQFGHDRRTDGRTHFQRTSDERCTALALLAQRENEREREGGRKRSLLVLAAEGPESINPAQLCIQSRS